MPAFTIRWHQSGVTFSPDPEARRDTSVETGQE